MAYSVWLVASAMLSNSLTTCSYSAYFSASLPSQTSFKHRREATAVTKPAFISHSFAVSCCAASRLDLMAREHTQHGSHAVGGEGGRHGGRGKVRWDGDVVHGGGEEAVERSDEGEEVAGVQAREERDEGVKDGLLSIRPCSDSHSAGQNALLEGAQTVQEAKST